MEYVLALLLMTASAGAAAAQTPDEKTPRPGATVTVTGCLTAGEQPGSFLLTRVKWDARPEDTKTTAGHHDSEPKGAKTASSDAKATETLRLAGLTARPTLSEHAGHTVTLTGLLAGEDRIVTPGIILPDPAGGAGKTERKPQASGKTGPRILNVRSVVKTGEACK